MSQFKILQLFYVSLVATQLTALCSAQEAKPDYNPEKKSLPTHIPSSIQPELKFGILPESLERSSANAFNRGLMPLESRLKYLALARDARLSNAGDSEAEVHKIWGNYRNQLAEIVPRIRRLNQPAASGWNAELILAQYAVLRADQNIASLNKDSNGFSAATSQIQQAAHSLYQQREWDYANGLASIQDLMYAKDRFMNSSQFDSVQRIDAIEAMILTQEKWNSEGAEIGRRDRIIESKLTKDLIKFQDALRSGEVPSISQSLEELSATGHEHFQTTLQYFKNGTAPLHQLSNSILIRHRLQRLSNEFPELKSEQAEKTFRSDWESLKSIAESTSDRRGRIESDLLAIKIMGMSVDQKTQSE